MDTELKYVNVYRAVTNDIGNEFVFSFLQRRPIFKEELDGKIIVENGDPVEMARIAMNDTMARQLRDSLNDLLSKKE